VSTPTVSVIIPTHNYGRFIGNALESVLTQTYRDLEVIVVDDGSTDNTREQLGPFADHIVYISQANAGVAAARNAGIQRSRGEYVAFLDADDVWLPSKIESSLRILREDPDTGVVYHWWGFIDQNGNPLPQKVKPTYRGDLLEQLLLGSLFTPSMSVLRRASLERVGVFDPAVVPAEDWDMWLRLAVAGYEFDYVPEVLTWSRIHDSNLSGNPTKLLERERIVLDCAFSRIPPHSQNESLRRSAYRNLFVSSATDYFIHGQPKSAQKLFTDGVHQQPEVLKRPGFYFGLAVGLLPYGHRTSKELMARHDMVAATLTGMLCELFSTPGISRAVASRRKWAWSTVWLVLAVLNGFRGQWLRACFSLARSFVINPLVSVTSVVRALSGRWRSVRATLQI
jgi:glycosyltransferase involved in cell wall biosynthesis